MQSVQSMCKCTCYVCLCCVWRFCIIYDEYPLMITAVCIHFTEHKSWTVREIDILGRRSLSNKARCLMDSFFFLLESPFFPFYYFSASSSIQPQPNKIPKREGNAISQQDMADVTDSLTGGMCEKSSFSMSTVHQYLLCHTNSQLW